MGWVSVKVSLERILASRCGEHFSSRNYASSMFRPQIKRRHLRIVETTRGLHIWFDDDKGSTLSFDNSTHYMHSRNYEADAAVLAQATSEKGNSKPPSHTSKQVSKLRLFVAFGADTKLLCFVDFAEQAILPLILAVQSHNQSQGQDDDRTCEATANGTAFGIVRPG
jgi:hypothetical protein